MKIYLYQIIMKSVQMNQVNHRQAHQNQHLLHRLNRMTQLMMFHLILILIIQVLMNQIHLQLKLIQINKKHLKKKEKYNKQQL